MRFGPALALLVTLLPATTAAQPLRDSWWGSRWDGAERPEPAGPEWSRFARAVADAMARCFATHRAIRDPLFFDRYVELWIRGRRLDRARLLLGPAPEALETCVATLPRRVRASVDYPSGPYVQAFVYDPGARRVDVIVPSPTPEALPLVPLVVLTWRVPVRAGQRAIIERSLVDWAGGFLPGPAPTVQDDLLDMMSSPPEPPPTGTVRGELVIDLERGRVVEVRDVDGSVRLGGLLDRTLFRARRSRGIVAVEVTITFRTDVADSPAAAISP